MDSGSPASRIAGVRFKAISASMSPWDRSGIPSGTPPTSSKRGPESGPRSFQPFSAIYLSPLAATRLTNSPRRSESLG